MSIPLTVGRDAQSPYDGTVTSWAPEFLKRRSDVTKAPIGAQ
jgi:hypothetical protein